MFQESMQRPHGETRCALPDCSNLANAAAIKAAEVAELKTWLQYKCFERRSSSESRNVIDTHRVETWRNIKDPPGDDHMVNRARLTVRGFKDTGAAGLAAFAGTTPRLVHMPVVAMAAQRG